MDVVPAGETFSMIMSTTRAGVIGAGGRMPWHEPADLLRFRRLTSGKAMIMGARTHEGIGRPLPGRPNIVLSAGRAYEGVVNCRSLEQAVAEAVRRTRPGGEVMVIGGASVFDQMLPRVTRMYQTVLRDELPGDVKFPCVMPGNWAVRLVDTDDTCGHPHDFYLWEKVG